MPNHVMIIDDEIQTRRALRVGLIAQGFEVTDARGGDAALETLRKVSFDLVLLDLGAEHMDGIATCRAIREFASIPIIVISGKRSQRNIIEALDAGADDFIPKPIDIAELMARIRAVNRRGRPAERRLLKFSDLEIDLHSRDVKRGDSVTHLTAKEFKLLQYLISRTGEVVSHRRLLQAVWGPEFGDEVEYLRVFIRQLRKKVEPDPAHPRYILTEPHAGYSFRGGRVEEVAPSVAPVSGAIRKHWPAEAGELRAAMNRARSSFRRLATEYKRRIELAEDTPATLQLRSVPDSTFAAIQASKAIAQMHKALAEYESAWKQYSIGLDRSLKPPHPGQHSRET